MKWTEQIQHENPEPGTHVGRCIKLIDLGTQTITWQGKTKSQRKVLITWELPDHLMEGKFKPEVKGLPFAVSRRFTQSLMPQSGLRQALEGWRGRKFSKEELASFDAKKLLGATCLLTLIESEGGEYINVAAIAPVPKTMPVPKQVNPSVYFSLEPGEFRSDVLASFGEKLQAAIMSSPEYKSLVAPASDVSDFAPPPEDIPDDDGAF